MAILFLILLWNVGLTLASHKLRTRVLGIIVLRAIMIGLGVKILIKIDLVFAIDSIPPIFDIYSMCETMAAIALTFWRRYSKL